MKKARVDCFMSFKECLLLWDLLLERLRSLAFLLSSSLARACVSNLICDSSLPWSHLFVGSPATSFSLYDPSYFLLLLDALGTGRLVGLGLSFSLTAGPAGGAAEDLLDGPVGGFSLLDLKDWSLLASTLDASLILALAVGFLSSTSGSAGSSGGSAGGSGLEPLSVDFLVSFLGDTDRRARRCTFLGGILPPALGPCPATSFGGSAGGSAGGVGLGGSSAGLLASFLGDTDLRALLCMRLVGIFPPFVTMSLSHQLFLLRRGWGDGVGGSGSGSGSAAGVGGADGWSQLYTPARVSSVGSSGSQGGCST